MDRIGFTAVLFSLLSPGIGCSEAVHTLGTLPAETKTQAACKDGSTLQDECGSITVASGGTGGNGNAEPKDGSTSEQDASTDAPSSKDDACARRSVVATRRGLNLFLVVDDSLSVVLQPEWGQLTAAISAFVDDPANAGLGVGVTYYGTSCNSQDYAVPTVAVAVLPGPANAITTSYPLPINGKAITPAMTGALSYVRTLRTAEPDRDTVMLLITDGILDPLCGSTDDTAAQVATLGVQGTPSVTTHVIGLDPGPTLIDPADIVDMSPLNAIAAAGGTSQAVVVQVNATGNTALTDGLNAVARSATPCEYRIPASIDADRASVEWQSTSGKPKDEWAHVADASACAGHTGVFVSKSAPGYLELCPASCTLVQASPASLAWVVEGC